MTLIIGYTAFEASPLFAIQFDGVFNLLWNLKQNSLNNAFG